MYSKYELYLRQHLSEGIRYHYCVTGYCGTSSHESYIKNFTVENFVNCPRNSQSRPLNLVVYDGYVQSQEATFMWAI